MYRKVRCKECKVVAVSLEGTKIKVEEKFIVYIPKAVHVQLAPCYRYGQSSSFAVITAVITETVITAKLFVPLQIETEEFIAQVWSCLLLYARRNKLRRSSFSRGLIPDHDPRFLGP